MWLLETGIKLTDATAVALILAFLYGIAVRSSALHLWTRLAFGVLFGIGAWTSILSPVEFTQGLTIDVRAVFVILSAGFLGWQAGLVTLVMVIFGRTVFAPLPPQGWSLIGWVYLSLVGQYLAALAWRRGRHLLGSRILLSALVLVALTQSVALILTNWRLILEVPDIREILEVQYGARCFGLLLTALVMLREERLLARDRANQERALRDPLTGLLNRRGLEKAMQEVKGSDTVAVFCVDLDHFKSLNDRLGHAAGDALLEVVARGFRHVVPIDGYLCRIGGDEFVALVPELSREQAADLAQALVDVMPRIHERWHSGMPITASVGYALGTGRDDLAQLLRCADAGLYSAKAAGRNTSRETAAGRALQTTDSAFPAAPLSPRAA